MTDDARRHVSLERVTTGVYKATTARGDELTFGSAEGAGFSPVELLLAAIGGCSAVDVDVVTGRRAEPDRFEIEVEADKVREDGGNILRDVRMTFHVTFPEGAAGDQARELLPRAVRTSHERTCTVSRTVEAAVPVEVRLDGPPTR
jgi:putative redox protein